MLLRHSPQKANLTLDREGWCSIQELVTNTDFSVRELVQIVQDDSKTRYAFMPSLGECLETGAPPDSIRANQGHSTSSVLMIFKKVIPPSVLYHGTGNEFIVQILKQGLLPIKRHHVHLSATVDVAEAVGGRRKQGFIVLQVDAKQMVADGLQLFISENNVYLANHVPSKYLKELK